MNKREPIEFFTAEREQKLDLIRHLLTNNKRPVLLRAPNGAGKSYFLARLEGQLGQQGVVCSVTVKHQLDDTNAIMASLAESLSVDSEQLSHCLSQKSERGEWIYLLIDDVHLVQGSGFESLLGYLGQFDAVRLVLTTAENLEVVESWCQVIDLEAFSQKQTAQYAKHLIEQGVGDPACDMDELVLFIETGGLPGRIHDAVLNHAISSIPVAKVKESSSVNRWGLISIFALSIGVVVLFMFYSAEPESSPPSGSIKPEHVKEQTQKIAVKSNEIAQAVVETGIQSLENKLETEAVSESKQVAELGIEQNKIVQEIQEDHSVAEKTVSADAKPASDKLLQASDASQKEPVLDQPKLKAVEEEAKKKKPTRLDLDRAWIESMPKEQFSFQIMGLGQLDSAMKYVQDRSDPQNLYIYRSKRNNGQWYGILYGVYADKNAATDAIPEVKQRFSGVEPWARSFESIQKDLYQ